MMEFKKYLEEVEAKLRSFDPQVPKEIAFNYIGGRVSKLEFLGLKVPQVKKAYEEGFSFLKEKEEKVAEIWNYIWENSNVYEVKSMGLQWFSDKKAQKDLIKHWPILKTWADKIDNWAHSDELSGLYSAILEKNPKLIYPTLKDWGDSVNPWLRRQSVVSLLYYSRMRKKVPPLKAMLKHVQKQLDFDHHYVQKGVGWTIREISNLYPTEAVEFMKKNFDTISATAFSAAIEKIPVKHRELLKNLRKTKRAAKPSVKRAKLVTKKPLSDIKAKTRTAKVTKKKLAPLKKKAHRR